MLDISLTKIALSAVTLLFVIALGWLLLTLFAKKQICECRGRC